MVRWQKRARLGLGVFGIACAIAVYAAIGDREASSPVERPLRLDPRAILESAGAAFQQFRDAKQEFVIEAERQLTYEDDTTKFIGITIKMTGMMIACSTPSNGWNEKAVQGEVILLS